MKELNIKKMVLTAFFMALGVILPFIVMQIPGVGNMLLPMHIPIILCGFLCGGSYGFVAGLIVPLLMSVVFGMPGLMPTAVAMSCELAVYGLVTGLLYQRIRQKRGGIYISLVVAMLAGRVVWGLVSFGLYHVLGNLFTWKLFAAQAFLNAIPGIVIQLILIPALVYRLKNTEVIKDNYGKKDIGNEGYVQKKI